MARHLSDGNIKAICEMLDGWRGPLTWETLVVGVEGLLGQRYTRQALNKHERIRNAYSVRKALAREEAGGPVRGSVEHQVYQERITRLEGELARLRAENGRLLEQFAVWTYNAAIHGLDIQDLNRPMPNTDRDRTRNLSLPTRPRR
jgi:hypothetical protein